MSYFIKLSFSLFLSIGAATIAFAQLEDLTKDTPFFKEQMGKYQQWLDHTGLGKTLKVYDIEVKPDRLSLYLAFPYNDLDSIMSSWTQVKADFEKAQPISLEQKLFYKMLHFMEVRQSMADVQIYDTYDLRKEPLFFRAIYFDEGQVQLEKSDPRSEVRQFFIPSSRLNRMKSTSSSSLKKEVTKTELFDDIFDFSKKYYSNKGVDGRQPSVQILENEEMLRFEVTDLRREVLIDETNPILCSLLQPLGLDCDWVKREWLTFQVSQKPQNNGVQIIIDIDGKYGSGLFKKVRRGGYISMEIEFDDYLKRYADIFKEELKAYLLRP